MSLAVLFHCLLLNRFRTLVHPSSGACNLFVISCVVLLWFDVCWCYGVVRLGWCGIRLHTEALVLLFHYFMLNMFRMLVHPSSEACDLFVELFHVLYCSGSMCVGLRCGSDGVVWYPYAG